MQYVPTDKINATICIHIRQILKVKIHHTMNANVDQLRHISNDDEVSVQVLKSVVAMMRQLIKSGITDAELKQAKLVSQFAASSRFMLFIFSLSLMSLPCLIY